MASRGCNAAEPSVTLALPDSKILIVEHPGVVKNVKRAIDSLGGERAIAKFLHSCDASRTIGLRLNPHDTFRKSISSVQKATSNVVIKITVPKPTGRKRKRGSSDDFQEHVRTDSDRVSPNGNLKSVFRSVRDNPNSCRVETAGMVEETHRFRTLPDFQYSLATSRLASSMKRNICSFEYEKIQEFKMDTETKGARKNMDMIPPPFFSQLDVPYPYGYYQNPFVKLTLDESGKQTAVNVTASRLSRNVLARFDDSEVPQGPPSDLEPVENLDPELQDLVRALGRIFDERPIVTRRVINERLGRNVLSDVRHAFKYHAYIFRSGPWRDCFVKYGLDPRKDPKWRVYQSFMFQIPIKDDSAAWEDGRVTWTRAHAHEVEPVKDSHIFDGKRVIANSKVWQACDITDPILRKILDDVPPSDTFHALQDGWYRNGVWAKVRVIMRDKITLLLSGVQPQDSDYQRCIAMPNDIKIGPSNSFHSIRDLGKREGTLAQEILNISRFSHSLRQKANNNSSHSANVVGDEEDRSGAEEDEEERGQMQPWVEEEANDNGDGAIY